jgi:hypothetical protein
MAGPGVNRRFYLRMLWPILGCTCACTCAGVRGSGVSQQMLILCWARLGSFLGRTCACECAGARACAGVRVRVRACVRARTCTRSTVCEHEISMSYVWVVYMRRLWVTCK